MGRLTETCDTCSDGCPNGMSCLSREQPEHPATVSAFALDKYEVTVGRFRRFMDAFDSNWRPSVGEGMNQAVELAQALPAGATGWDSAWDSQLAAVGYEVSPDDGSLEDLIQCNPNANWTTTPAENELYPINCMTWYEAFAFCVWDGGRLPTEAEWEFAAAGGNENRLFPWGNDLTAPLPALYAANGNSGAVPVGSRPAGNGRWDHADLAGSMAEWTFDWHALNWYTTTQSGCFDCANLTVETYRTGRGGAFPNQPERLRAASRIGFYEDYHDGGYGIRCARAP
jgi:formylglycine-generating enzyme required for sulfatase activity